MSLTILERARDHLVQSLRGKQNAREVTHPWRKEWRFAILHSLRVERYVVKILAREQHALSEDDIDVLRLAAILHDIARLDQPERHAAVGAEIARGWLLTQNDLTADAIERIVDLIATHSDKTGCETDYGRAILKDADILDEIGVMSVFMAGNWLDAHSPFFFDHLHERLVTFEVPYCDRKMALLSTPGARAILAEKREFILRVIDQLTDEIQLDVPIEDLALHPGPGA